jgi:hypothetical protein
LPACYESAPNVVRDYEQSVDFARSAGDKCAPKNKMVDVSKSEKQTGQSPYKGLEASAFWKTAV